MQPEYCFQTGCKCSFEPVDVYLFAFHTGQLASTVCPCLKTGLIDFNVGSRHLWMVDSTLIEHMFPEKYPSSSIPCFVQCLNL
jgi:hypothetical protein